jgi:hypothetical protein
MADQFNSQNLFSAFQRGLVKRLADGLAGFYLIPQGVLVIAEDEGDIDTKIAKTVGKIGLCLVVVFTTVRRGEIQKGRTIEIQVSGFENVIINRASTGTRVALVDVMTAVDGLLDGWPPVGIDGVELPFSPPMFEQSLPVSFGAKGDPTVERGSTFTSQVMVALEEA